MTRAEKSVEKITQIFDECTEKLSQGSNDSNFSQILVDHFLDESKKGVELEDPYEM